MCFTNFFLALKEYGKGSKRVENMEKGLVVLLIIESSAALFGLYSIVTSGEWSRNFLSKDFHIFWIICVLFAAIASFLAKGNGMVIAFHRISYRLAFYFYLGCIAHYYDQKVVNPVYLGLYWILETLVIGIGISNEKKWPPGQKYIQNSKKSQQFKQNAYIRHAQGAIHPMSVLVSKDFIANDISDSHDNVFIFPPSKEHGSYIV